MTVCFHECGGCFLGWEHRQGLRFPKSFQCRLRADAFWILVQNIGSLEILKPPLYSSNHESYSVARDIECCDEGENVDKTPFPSHKKHGNSLLNLQMVEKLLIIHLSQSWSIFNTAHRVMSHKTSISSKIWSFMQTLNGEIFFYIWFLFLSSKSWHYLSIWSPNHTLWGNLVQWVWQHF